jgi:hypothetical protein
MLKQGEFNMSKPVERELNEKIVEQWERLRVLMASTEDDVYKNARGNVTAGVRLRKGLRALKSEVQSLIKLTIVEGNEKRKQREQERQDAVEA